LYLLSVYLDYQLHLLSAFAAIMPMVNKDYQNCTRRCRNWYAST